MATSHAGKYCRSPYPTSYTCKKRLTVLITGGGETFWISPGTKFLSLLGGRLFLLGDMPPTPPTSHTDLHTPLSPFNAKRQARKL